MNRGLCFNRKPHAAWGGDSDKPASFVVLCKLELPFWDICVARPCLIGTPLTRTEFRRYLFKSHKHLHICKNCQNVAATVLKNVKNFLKSQKVFQWQKVKESFRKFLEPDAFQCHHNERGWTGPFFCGTMAPMAQHKMVKSRSFHVKPSKSNFVNIFENYTSTLVI